MATAGRCASAKWAAAQVCVSSSPTTSMRGARTRAEPIPSFFLHLLDELDEFRNRVHAQQRQKPAIELERLLRFALARQIEQVDRLARQGVDEAGDPSHSAGGDAFDDGVVDADADCKPVAESERGLRLRGGHRSTTL